MNKDLDNILTVFGNLCMFGVISYAVFVLGFTGWWFGLMFLMHFKTSENNG